MFPCLRNVQLLLCCCCITVAVHSQTLSGTVRSSGNTATAIPGVTVNVKGSSRGTLTNEKGQYNLPGVLPADTIIFSFIGYKRMTVPVKGRAQIDIQLEEEVASLNQVVVIGYGTTTKKDLTGAVASIKAARLQNENPSSVQDVLRANVPGLNVGFNSSAKGGGSLQVRGKNTLNAGSSPLIVLDGIIYYGAMEDINPNDIESVDVLKDASAAAVYGAKSASGVIAVTTKKGRSGKPVINVSARLGLATMGVQEQVYDPEGFINWRSAIQQSIHITDAKPHQFSDPRKLPSNISVPQWLAYDASSGDPVSVWLRRLNMQAVEIENYKNGKNINWYDKVFRTGLRQDYTVSLSGGRDEYSYYWSLGYMNNEGIVTGDQYNTVRSRLNMEGKVTRFLTVGMNTQFSVRDESAMPVEWAQMETVSPWGSMYGDDGRLRWSPQDDPAVSRNPLLRQAYTDRLQKYYTLNASLYAKVALPFGFTYQVNFTPRFEWYQLFHSQSSQSPEWEQKGGLAHREDHQLYQWQIDNLLTWSKTFNDIHQVNLTLLANSEKYQYWEGVVDNNGFSPNDNLGYHDIGSGINPVLNNDDQYSTGDALMARLFYSLKQRYMLTLSLRRDGYSAFGQKNPRASFPAAALGWTFTEEPFFRSKWPNYGKLRLSYGVNGNRDIGRYAALANISTGKYLHVNPNGTVTQVPELSITSMSNPNLKWERTAAFNVGLDFSLFNNVLDGSIDVYKSKTTNLLVQRSLPDVLGFEYIWDNLGEVDNKGLEFSLNSKNITRERFSWNTSFNFSLNRNKIARLYGDMVDIKDASGKVIGQKEADDLTNKWFIGQSVDAIWDTHVLGVWQLNEAEEAKKYGLSPGDFKLKDVNNDGKYTNDDKEFLGYTEPRFRWTLRNEFTIFKNISFSFLLYSYWGHSSTFNEAKNQEGYPDRNNSYIMPYWTPENPLNDYARLVSSNGSANYNIYRKRSFIRLDNIALGYTLPRELLRRASINNMRVYFTVKNAAMYASDWIFWDPEWSSAPGPTPRNYTLGVDITL